MGDKTYIAFNNINDHHFKNIEKVSINPKVIQDKIINFKLKSFIKIKNIFCKLGLMKYSIGEVILFKKEPKEGILCNMRKYKWEFKILPKNPYL